MGLVKICCTTISHLVKLFSLSFSVISSSKSNKLIYKMGFCGSLVFASDNDFILIRGT